MASTRIEVALLVRMSRHPATEPHWSSWAWSRAIQGASPCWGGISYLSRQMEKDLACAIFERSGLRKLRAEKLKARQVNALSHGLTLGVQTRIADTARVDSVYVNRNIIGAVVGVQPFGGEGLSGTGPKAGGPHAL